ncbi:MAG: di-trans,poly-cis-decaprenylcistransferase [Nevskiaceae bacterium]|nr:di-trans,poly-cis-decaprenylcistransferase [Nevskiaceae bacterium]
MTSTSSNTAGALPRHVAIIMDGNGRWATQRGQPRQAGHKAGVRPVRLCIEQCARRGIAALTLFAFSSENWGRPSEEVGALMSLFVQAMDDELDELHRSGVKLRFIGDRLSFPVRVQSRLVGAEARTAANTGLQLQIAMGYGGRWDIVQATRKLAARAASGALRPADINEATLSGELALTGLPEPDLFIRTGGEQRISNFLLWNLAYTELYFCDALWPDFDEQGLQAALDWFAGRERRYGLTATTTGGA